MSAALDLALRPWRGLDAFDALGAEWERCARAARLDPLCNSHGWTRAYARAFVPPDDAFGWVCETSAGEPAAVIALRREPRRGALALRRALFLADGSFDSDYLAPPVKPGHEPAVARALVDAARSVRGVEALVLAGVPEDSPFLAALRAELERRGLPRRELAAPGLCAALPDAFDAYLAGLKPRMRTKVRSAMRAASEQGAALRWCEREEELDPWLAELFRLHELRWRATGGSGSFADPRRRAFYRELTRAALQRGVLRFASLAVAGRTLATQLGLRADDRYYQIQEGFDPAHEDGRVGIALRGLAVQRLIAEGVRAYDFMAGDSGHKRDWGGELRPCTTVAFPLERWRARLAYGLRGLAERIGKK